MNVSSYTMQPRPAAVLTIGTELVAGMRADTNGPEIARTLTSAGYDVVETLSVPDDRAAVASALRRLMGVTRLLVVTGGLGPTHDDVTREAAADATGRPLVTNAAVAERLGPVLARHTGADALAAVARQAEMLEDARIIMPGRGTAPGQVVEIGECTLALLPGPPSEMRAMLDEAIPAHGPTRAAPQLVRCVGITESEAQAAAEPVVLAMGGMSLTLLAKPALVDVILLDTGCGATVLEEAATMIAETLSAAVYAREDLTLAEVVIGEARSRSLTVATAESCTGGLVAAALTDVPGSSDVFLGSIVAYSNSAKTRLLDVPEEILSTDGAVSESCAIAMARGARAALGADIAVSITGVAGPGGGSVDKPVGTVWHGISTPEHELAVVRQTFGDREGVRVRSVAYALDLLRRELIRS